VAVRNIVFVEVVTNLNIKYKNIFSTGWQVKSHNNIPGVLITNQTQNKEQRKERQKDRKKDNYGH